jgi:endonuclease/exonuclease/phosphatase family metal-dependent hydrolase
LACVPLCVLTWNLKHGRAVPSAGRDLFEDFLAALAGWRWDVALLQEVPPWWPSLLGARLRADWRLVLTSRNAGLAARRALATRWPDAIKSNGGGCNAVLVRQGSDAVGAIAEHRILRLTWLPERRWLIAVRPARPGEMWVGNVHLTGGHGGAAVGEARAAAAAMLKWAGDRGSAVLGGDFNLSSLALDGFSHAAGVHVDHVFARGLDAAGEAEVLDSGPLSDHAPLRVALRR